jgi:chromosomal replication initiator protein
MNSAADVWSRVLDILGTNLTSTAITTWFDDCKVIDLYDNRLVLYSPSNFKKDVIEGRFIPSIKSALHEIFSCDFEIILLGEGELEPYQSASTKTDLLSDGEEFTFEAVSCRKFQ